MIHEQSGLPPGWLLVGAGTRAGGAIGDYVGYALAGLGGGAVIAALALGLILAHRTSGVVDLSHAAVGVYVAFASFEFRESGDLVLPLIGLPARVHLLPTPTLAAQLLFTAALAALLGVTLFLLVFRPLRRAPPLARLVASLGLLLYLQEVVRLRFPTVGSAVTQRRPVLPEDRVSVLGTGVTANRLLLAVGVVAVAGLLALVFRTTRFGLTVRAAADDERAALLCGLSPDRAGAIAWALATTLSAFAVLLIEPIAGLDPRTTSLLVVPALGAALLGALRSFVAAAVAGLGIGVVQSLILGWAVRPDTTVVPDWLPTTGLQQAVTVVAIVGALVWRGDALPTRGELVDRRLPASPQPRHLGPWAVALGGLAALVLLTAGADVRQGLIVTLVAVPLTLSVVVVTGYVGQISLASLAIAGVAGFTAVDLGREGLPFPLAVLVGVAAAVAVGVVVGLPATRVRGMGLAVATIAAAVAIEALVLASSAVSGGAAGRKAPRPYLFGVDVGISAPGDANFRPAFGFVALAVAIASGLAVANLRRSPTGLRWLAVRANERAAAAAGIDVPRAKLGAFAVSSALAGLSGALTAYATSTVSPASFMVIGALVALALTYLAGIASVSGAVLAAVITQSGLLAVLGAADDPSAAPVYAVSGVVLIVAAIVAPDGLTGAGRQLWRRVAAR